MNERKSAFQRHAPEAQLIEVIEVRYVRGHGVAGDPVRLVIAYYSKDGELLAEHDDWAERTAAEEASA
jgi:hypothetical protein